MKTLLEGIATAMATNISLLRFGAREMRPGEAAISFGNNAKARAILGWSPRPLDQALREDLISSPAQLTENAP